ncbi:AT-rich interactive domain-containing protein 2-like [Solanum pennellii]|uniref:AT-rich interactive domain-containing protein 2-like n=1 Tax=Solanum pennellii TaxID=28526 RepID=A0ABM1H163_SOLPN|nr:AT-rich interactive domain-containing protein 2-like [Solanum pennellii]
MTKAKELPDTSLTSEKKKEWCEFIYEDSEKLVIPVGPRFQAVVPDWANSPNVGTPVVVADTDNALRATKKEIVCKYKEEESDTSKWLGTRVWPRANNLENKEDNEELVGKGRNEHCTCRSPGSVECVKRHVKEEGLKLWLELLTAFTAWKFGEMGEEVSNVWNLKEQKRFSSIIKKCLSKGESFMRPALESIPSKNRQSIIKYYFNVHIPRRIRSNSKTNTDDEEEEDEEEEVTAPKHSRKRKGACSTSKSLKRKYLSGRR